MSTEHVGVSPPTAPPSAVTPQFQYAANETNININNNINGAATIQKDDGAADSNASDLSGKPLAPRSMARRPTQPLQANLRNRKSSVTDQEQGDGPLSEDLATPPESTPVDDSAVTSDAASVSQVVRGKAKGGRPRGRARGGRARGRGRGTPTDSLSQGAATPPTSADRPGDDPVDKPGDKPADNNPGDPKPGRAAGPGSRGGKGAYAKPKKPDTEEELETELLNGTCTDIDIVFPEYSRFPKPLSQLKLHKSRLESIARECGNFTLEQLRERQSALARFVRDGSRLMLDRNIEHVKRSYGALNRATPAQIEESRWYRKVRFNLEMQEAKQMAHLEKRYTVAQGSADKAFAAEAQKIHMAYEVKPPSLHTLYLLSC